MALRCSSWVSALECAFQEWEPITVADLSHVFVPQEDTQVCCSRSDATALPLSWGEEEKTEGKCAEVRPASGDKEARAVATGQGKDVLKTALQRRLSRMVWVRLISPWGQGLG